jgi:hypothetical protein
MHIISPFPSSPSRAYMNPSFGSGGTMGSLSISWFDRGHIPQPNLTVGSWNLPYYGSNPRITFPEASSQMDDYSAYHTLSIYHSSIMSVPTGTFPMTTLHLSSSISYGGSHFYGMGYPLHGIPASRGNIYPHLSNLGHTFLSS